MRSDARSELDRYPENDGLGWRGLPRSIDSDTAPTHPQRLWYSIVGTLISRRGAQILLTRLRQGASIVELADELGVTTLELRHDLVDRVGRSAVKRALGPEGLVDMPQLRKRPEPAEIATRNAEIVRMRLEGLTLEQIAAQVRLTRERVRQVVAKQLGKSQSRAVLDELRATRRATRQAVRAAAASRTRLDRRRGERVPLGIGRSRHSDLELLAVLRHAATMAFPLSPGGYNRLRRQGLVVGPQALTISRRFGSWEAACASAEVESDQRKARADRWSDTELLKYIRWFLSGDVGLGTFGAYDQWARNNGAPSSATARVRFGTWSRAKRLATDLVLQEELRD